MPKMKTRRAAAKRYTVTGSGKIRGRHGGASHLLGHKTRKHKRRLKKNEVLNPAMASHAARALPYGN
ncbi:MAG: 50S ribosomal protein L35 [Myxococcales bacterium]|nr:50S ribosomal protein L35 [Myxococcales bacterium]